ncbi:hypothetical protein [Nocardia lijiangensis]|uniref:hypothetical protein n=1 Tax=Nocardia lijiangensis TaxID=299618 RepID=UPI0008367066|nr:hypothetical protein [Nocardia lijiangensis]
MSTESRYDAYEADLWNRLASLLPSAEDAENFRDCREIGEQEAGLWLLTQRLLEHRIPIGDTTRAEIEVLAEQWGERLARHDEIASCVGDSGQDASVRLLSHDRAQPTDPAAVGITNAVLEGLLVVPWIECPRCGRVLARVHALEPWGDLRYLASYYIVWLPHDAVGSEPELFAETDLHSAFDLLLTCP